MSTKELRKKRIRLHSENPCCCYCGVETILKPMHDKRAIEPDEWDRIATIDHIRPRHHPDRRKPPEPHEVLRVLACAKCNNERDKRELAQKPKEWFEERGGSTPIHKRSIEDLVLIYETIKAKGLYRKVGKGGMTNRNKFIKSQIKITWELWERGYKFQ